MILGYSLWLSWLAASCTAAPQPAAPAANPVIERVEPIPRDPCGSTPDAPWHNPYDGVLKGARCEAEVQVIMKDVAESLGVGCTYCHQAADYAATTHNKRVANWMARELASKLVKRDGGGPVWCADCHRRQGHGVAKILGDPRDPSLAVEWMTAHLTAQLDAASGEPLYCTSCHRGAFGQRDFEGTVIPIAERGNDRVEQAGSSAERDARGDERDKN